LKDDEPVVIQTDAGQMIGHIVASPVSVLDKHVLGDPPPQVIRRATEHDLAIRRRHEEREREAFRVAVMKIRERNLAMKLTRVEQTFDASRLIFYFTADERVDFRELVRELASEFKTRIELRQIGVRDEARLLAGYGTCGRPLCCSTWLKTFEPVSIKMAKQQDLALNPARLSGVCGRLKCCLRYELNHAAPDRPEVDEAYPASSDEDRRSGCGGCSGGRCR